MLKWLSQLLYGTLGSVYDSKIALNKEPKIHGGPQSLVVAKPRAPEILETLEQSLMKEV